MPVCQCVEGGVEIVEHPRQRANVRLQFAEKIIPMYRDNRVCPDGAGGFVHEGLLVGLALFAQAGTGQQGVVGLIAVQLSWLHSCATLNQDCSCGVLNHQSVTLSFFPGSQQGRWRDRFGDLAFTCPVLDDTGQGDMPRRDKVEGKVTEPVRVVGLYRGDALFFQSTAASHHGGRRRAQNLCSCDLRDNA
tara:strand:+ start:3257 stop:3826 length:570 start_codon:yes stop_codon:yes gene_type:complete